MVSTWRGGGGFDHVAQGFAPTSVAQGDVGLGVHEAIDDLESRFGLASGSRRPS